MLTSCTYRIVAVHNDKAQLDKLGTYLSEGKLKPVIDSVFSFSDVYKAYERLMSKHAKGKVVVDVTAVDS
jgi:NADPH:quinone reductase-like Zn-dependent oxidoreductase